MHITRKNSTQERTRGGPGDRDRMLTVKRRTNAQKSVFFVAFERKKKLQCFFYCCCIYPLLMQKAGEREKKEKKKD